MTHLEKRQEELSKTKCLIFKILDIDEDRYSELQFELAYKWLSHRKCEHQFWMTKTKAFWGWWKNTFYMMNQEFVEYLQESQGDKVFSYSKDVMMDIFIDCHISNEQYPTDSIYSKINRQSKKVCV